MKPIISPWVVYLIETLSTIRVCLTIFFLVWVLDGLVDGKKKIERLKKMGKFPFVAGVIVILLMLFIPSKETMYTMFVTKTVTYDNAETVTNIIKDNVDYITEKME